MSFLTILFSVCFALEFLSFVFTRPVRALVVVLRGVRYERYLPCFVLCFCIKSPFCLLSLLFCHLFVNAVCFLFLLSLL